MKIFLSQRKTGDYEMRYCGKICGMCKDKMEKN